MANLQIKDKNGNVRIYNNVSILKFKDTDGNDVSFASSLYQRTIFMKSALEFYSSQENNQNVPTTIPAEPTETGKIFKGWSEVSHEYIKANKVQLPKVYNSDQTLYAMWLETPSGGATVSEIGSSSPGSVAFNVDASFTQFLTDMTNGDYDETDAYGNVFVKIPTVYRKVQVVEDGQITAITLALSKLDDNYKPYPCFVKADGVTVMPYIMIGKYCFTSSSEASSVSGTAVSMTLGAARPLAVAKGTGYHLYDWKCQRLFQDLVMVAKQSVNVNQNPLLGIYHLDGGVWVDGIARNNTQWLCCYDYTKYVDSPSYTSADNHTDGYNLVSYAAPTTNGQEIKKLGYDPDNPFFNYPAEVINNGSYNTYYCDGYYYAGGNYPVVSSVGSSDASYGLWHCRTNYAWSSAVRVRLVYEPVA